MGYKNKLKRIRQDLFVQACRLCNLTTFNRFVCDVERRVDRAEVFFILGLGRSGTSFLAELLNGCDGVSVYHEPVFRDYHEEVFASQESSAKREYIKKYRLWCMWNLIRSSNPKCYGEVNSLLRYHVRELKQCFPSSRLLYIVRDGRNVVSSIMARNHYRDNARGHHAVSPLYGSAYYEKWKDMNRFEKVCWLWADSNQRLRKQLGTAVQLEQLVSSYPYFKEHVESALQIDVGEIRWGKYVDRPRNTTKNVAEYVAYDDWTEVMKKSFSTICREEMLYAGYDCEPPL